MDRRLPLVPVFLAAFSLLLLGLPPQWTAAFKLRLLGTLRPLADAASAPPPADAASPSGRDAELERLHYENLSLAQKVARLSEENAQLRMKVESLAQLRRVVAENRPKPIDAPVIFPQDPSDWHRTMLIGRGTRDGVAAGDVVVWGAHLVGRIVPEDPPGPSVSRVRLITDGGFRLPALVASGETARTPAERLTGVLEGQGVETCALNWITHDMRIEAGWPVVTAEDPLSTVPPYLLLGRISAAAPQPGLFQRVRVRPALRFSNLAWVQVIKGQEAAEPPPRAPRPGKKR